MAATGRIRWVSVNEIGCRWTESQRIVTIRAWLSPLWGDDHFV